MAGSEFPLWQRRLLVLAAPAVIIAFVGVLLASMVERSGSTARVQRTYGTIALLQQVRTRMVDAETGQRGYLITGDTTYLSPYHQAAADTRAALDSLAATLAGAAAPSAGPAAPREGLARLRELVTARLDILERPIERREESFEAARAQMLAGGGQEAMQELRRQLRELEELEQAKLAAELRAQRRAGLLVLAALLVGAAVVLLVSYLIRARFAAFERQLEGANAALSELNDKLQQQAIELELQTEELQAQTARLKDTGNALAASNEELLAQHERLQDLALELELANEELRAANNRAEDRRAEAEAANRVKTEFLTAMSHELRTPLNAIAGYVDLLDLDVQGPLTDQQRRSVERIRLNGQHLLVLINDILDYARIQAGRVQFRNRDVPLDGVITQTAELVQPLLQARSLTIDVETAAGDLAVHGDPDRIRQILLNLLTNAAKYTPRGGTIRVSTDAGPERVSIRIRDTGIGIPPELQRAIFDPFVRLNLDAGGSIGDGVGLGLSISRELAAAMAGELSVDSSPGEGSTFTLTLGRAAALSA